MVAEHQDDSRLLLLAEVVDERFKRLVGLVCQRQVLFCHRIFSWLVGQCDLSRIILDSVAAVVLDSDIKQEQALVRGLVFKLVDDLFKGRLVADIAVLLGQWDIHVVHTFKLVEAKQRISLIALPGGALTRMNSQRAVAVFLEQRRQRSRRL